MKSLFGGGLGLAAALSTASLLFYTSPLAAETNLSAKPQPTPVQERQEEALNSATVPLATELFGPSLSSTASPAARSGTDAATAGAKATRGAASTEMPASAPVSYVATAYALRGRGASGLGVRKGTIAADPRVLPFGTRVRLDAGAYSGEYLVTDSGGAVKGRKIDVWVPTYSEACRFGRRNVRLTVLSYGGKRGASSKKSVPAKKQN